MADLHRYLDRLQDTIQSRSEIEVKELEIEGLSSASRWEAEFYTRLQFYDGSQLHITEKLLSEGFSFTRVRYVYHYQQADGTLIFRYDSIPHYPDIDTYPDHKHVGDTVIGSQPPDLSEVLQEIDAILYPQ